MPIIIEELVISVEVANPAPGDPCPIDADLQQAIVQRCVDRVLEILRERKVVRFATDE